eukprot:100508-Chlamydomonas_euryale.AAC.1
MQLPRHGGRDAGMPMQLPGRVGVDAGQPWHAVCRRGVLALTLASHGMPCAVVADATMQVVPYADVATVQQFFHQVVKSLAKI